VLIRGIRVTFFGHEWRELTRMKELIYREEAFQLIGFCMEIHRELGRGHDEIIYKDAFVVELSRSGIPFFREKIFEVTYKGAILAHPYYADFVVWDKILFEAKAVEKFSEAHTKQVLNYLAASKPVSACSLISARSRWNGSESSCDATLRSRSRFARIKIVLRFFSIFSGQALCLRQ
jgi:GxxExxY protein